MNDRSTVTIVTPYSKAEVVILDYLNGGELIELEVAGIKNVNAGPKGVNFDGGETYKMRLKKLVYIVIKSFNGNEEKDFIWNSVCNLRAGDYNFVIEKLNLCAADMLEAEEEKKNN